RTTPSIATPTPAIYTLSLHDALPISLGLKPSDIRVITDMDTARDAWSIASGNYASRFAPAVGGAVQLACDRLKEKLARAAAGQLDRKSTRLNSSHSQISYAVFCLKKK